MVGFEDNLWMICFCLNIGLLCVGSLNEMSEYMNSAEIFHNDAKKTHSNLDM